MKLRRKIFATCFLLPMMFSVSALAETISFAEAYDRLAKSCGSDIEKLCANAELGGGEVRACLNKNQARVSAGCKATSAEVFASLERRINAQRIAAKVCERDIGRFCRGVQPHDGYQLQCLLTASKVISVDCQEIITDAGWR